MRDISNSLLSHYRSLKRQMRQIDPIINKGLVEKQQGEELLKKNKTTFVLVILWNHRPNKES